MISLRILKRKKVEPKLTLEVVTPNAPQTHSYSLYCRHLGIYVNITKQGLFSFLIRKIRDESLYDMSSIVTTWVSHYFGGLPKVLGNSHTFKKGGVLSTLDIFKPKGGNKSSRLVLIDVNPKNLKENSFSSGRGDDAHQNTLCHAP